mmetsp:Transcript_33977/g.97876  ORF Transcript_33977/g.97876 Transcript_33977/m.97876 type:complete len:169 (-) Transcript_33977:277-783(-)
MAGWLAGCPRTTPIHHTTQRGPPPTESACVCAGKTRQDTTDRQTNRRTGRRSTERWGTERAKAMETWLTDRQTANRRTDERHMTHTRQTDKQAEKRQPGSKEGYDRDRQTGRQTDRNECVCVCVCVSGRQTCTPPTKRYTEMTKELSLAQPPCGLAHSSCTRPPPPQE